MADEKEKRYHEVRGEDSTIGDDSKLRANRFTLYISREKTIYRPVPGNCYNLRSRERDEI